MKRTKRWRALLCLGLGLCLILGMAGLSGCQTSTESLQKITISEVTHSIFYAPFYAAIENGFFEEEGLEVELSNAQGTDKVMSAVLSGQIDIGFGGPEAAIYVYNEGREDYIQVVGQLTKRDGSFLVGKDPSEEPFDWNEVRGKTIIPGRKGGVPYMTLEYLLKQKGIDPETDVTLDDSIQFSLMAGAFTGGEAEYVSLFEPTASMVEQEGKGYILTSIGQDSGEIPYTTFFATKSYIEANPETVQKLINAVYKGQKWVLEHSSAEVAQAIQASFPDTELDLLTTVIDNYKAIDVWNETPVLEQTPFELLQTVMTSAGELKQNAPYDIIVNNSFAQKAVETVE